MTIAIKIFVSIVLSLVLAVAALWAYHVMNSDVPALQVMTIATRYLIENLVSVSVLLILLGAIIFDSMASKREADVYAGTDGMPGEKLFTIPKLSIYPLAGLIALALLVAITNEGMKSRLGAASTVPTKTSAASGYAG
jgi:hypothetical protein